ncbi:prolipoprotein diacylglyceryl transferase [Priestia megaterium]|jgi:phosphatidylglycerol:prolipoprotein diacylglycerol transferase|uniref:prolipoprotein diacylglyceryl transferase n=1 Tax=Priestia megaterium TaxID=1404 RepID=UPI00227EEDE9|nr:prolipoprotein diacylglyceryl transferase [Priestia megaterium]MCY9020601.1 prolipoprotein diacylglyceryl transferase [Priestia megaterium]MCY9026097.1 prolipoprotein diacylglyceryl transferase [Priestia megaterium]
MNQHTQPLNPIAFHLGPLEVHWYGIIIGIGAFLGFLLASKEGKKRGISSETISDLLLLALPIAIITARIYYVLFEWSYYKDHPGEIIAIWHGGIAIHGGIIGSVLTAIWFCRKKNLSFWKMADVLAPSLLLGQAIGRWGNFMNQEAHGGPVTRQFLEALHLPDFIINQMYINGTYYHPTFLYESLWNIIGVLVLIVLRKSLLKRGEVFLTYLLWYSIGRFFIEGLRTDSLMLTSHIRIAQLVSFLCVLGSLILLWYRRKKGLATSKVVSLS